jgi:hypothetical protein
VLICQSKAIQVFLIINLRARWFVAARNCKALEVKSKAGTPGKPDVKRDD